MNPIITNFLTHLKSKQLSEWDIRDLYDMIWPLEAFYKYTAIQEEKDILTSVFNKIVVRINEAKKGFVVNPGMLMLVDRELVQIRDQIKKARSESNSNAVQSRTTK